MFLNMFLQFGLNLCYINIVKIPVTWEHMGRFFGRIAERILGPGAIGDNWNMVENFWWLGWLSLNSWCNLEWRKAPLRGSSVASTLNYGSVGEELPDDLTRYDHRSSIALWSGRFLFAFLAAATWHKIDGLGSHHMISMQGHSLSPQEISWLVTPRFWTVTSVMSHLVKCLMMTTL